MSEFSGNLYIVGGGGKVQPEFGGAFGDFMYQFHLQCLLAKLGKK